jgi:hypothetical protein
MAGRVGDVNLPAQQFKHTCFIDSGGRIDADRHTGLVAFRRVNGVCHRGLASHTRKSYTEFDLENELLWYARNLSHVRTRSLRRGAPDGPRGNACAMGAICNAQRAARARVGKGWVWMLAKLMSLRSNVSCPVIPATVPLNPIELSSCSVPENPRALG